jgi:hypothetical protein
MNRVLRVVALALSALVFTALCGILLTANAAFGNVFSEMTDEAKALIDKGLIMKVYQPDKHSGCHVDYIMAESKKTRVAILIFGMEDVGAARSEGVSMAESSSTPDMAERFLFAEGWNKYHDRFFTRAYVQEGMDAYEKAGKSK